MILAAAFDSGGAARDDGVELDNGGGKRRSSGERESETREQASGERGEE